MKKIVNAVRKIFAAALIATLILPNLSVNTVSEDNAGEEEIFEKPKA